MVLLRGAWIRLGGALGFARGTAQHAQHVRSSTARAPARFVRWGMSVGHLVRDSCSGLPPSLTHHCRSTRPPSRLSTVKAGPFCFGRREVSRGVCVLGGLTLAAASLPPRRATNPGGVLMPGLCARCELVGRGGAHPRRILSLSLMERIAFRFQRHDRVSTLGEPCLFGAHRLPPWRGRRYRTMASRGNCPWRPQAHRGWSVRDRDAYIEHERKAKTYQYK